VLNNQSEKLLFEQCCGPSALNPLTRFSHGNEAILELSLFLSKQEQDLYPGCIIADIVHLPEGNLGNVTAHPHLTKYEIPVLSTSSLDENYQIDLSDLLVSIVNENIVLRSNKLNKTIIPRVSNAHNFSTSSLHVYKFLCDIQVQSFQKNNLSFSWGNISMIFDFLPRVEYRNTILSPAIWFVKRKDIEGLQQHYDSFQKWTIKHGLPDRFILVDNDNEIFIDTNDKMSRALFLDMSAKKDRIVLKEFVFNTDNPLVRDPVGAFTNECLAILYRKYTPGNASGINKDPTERTGAKEVKRSFMPGEEWLYFKIYCGIKSSDAMLRGEVRRIVNQLTEEKLIEQWFFLRHNDPEEHIRIRFRLLNKSSFAKAVQIIQQELKQSFKDGVISNIQLDTYVRELERYGPDTIEITEQIFHIESMLTLDLLDHIKIYNDKKLRWYYSLIAIDSLLNEFGFSNEQKHRLVSVLYHSYFEEHKGDKKLTVSLNDNYRKNRQTINSLIRNQLGSELPEGFLQVLKNRYSGVTPLIQAIKKIELSGKLQVSLNDFISSIVHMLVNRIFICRQRTNEMILYHMLLKFYSSEKFIGQN
jgi:thiopeptide-type bacteriocin biosynthesis protein